MQSITTFHVTCSGAGVVYSRQMLGTEDGSRAALKLPLPAEAPPMPAEAVVGQANILLGAVTTLQVR